MDMPSCWILPDPFRGSSSSSGRTSGTLSCAHSLAEEEEVMEVFSEDSFRSSVLIEDDMASSL